MQVLRQCQTDGGWKTEAEGMDELVEEDLRRCARPEGSIADGVAIEQESGERFAGSQMGC